MCTKGSRTSDGGERGFTLIELLVATVVSMLVLGGAVALTSQVQNGYRRQVEAAAAEQEGRYALDWIGRLIRGAGNNPFNLTTSDCPAAATPFQFIRFDPDADGVDNDIRLQTDSFPPDGQLGGAAGTCNQANEDITVSFDPATNSILFLDNNLLGEASIRTDAVIEGLQFLYFNSEHVQTTDPSVVVYVETRITTRTRTMDSATGLPVTRVLSSEVRVRSR